MQTERMKDRYPDLCNFYTAVRDAEYKIPQRRPADAARTDGAYIVYLCNPCDVAGLGMILEYYHDPFTAVLREKITMYRGRFPLGTVFRTAVCA